MAGQPLETASPDKQALATVLSYLKDRQLKETELALRRELGLEKTSVSEDQTTIISHSDLEPAKYEESYSRLAPLPSTSTKIEIQSACHSDSLEDAEPLSLDEMEEDSEPEDEMVAEVSSLQEEKRSYSWPGSLPNHLLKFPENPLNFNKAQLKADKPFPSKPLPLWAVGYSALKPKSINLPSPPLSSRPLPPSVPAFYPTSSTAPSPTVLCGMLPPQGMGLSKHALTPLLTIMQPGSLASVTEQAKSPPQPLLISPTKPLSLSSLTQAPIANLMSPPHRDSVSSCASSPGFSCASDTVQSTQLPVEDVSNQVPPQRTLASIPPSEMTPQYAELKAFAEEFKTKRIRLGYTQGAIGQSLAQKGYSNFAQSTISRFEQMQLSATNAAAIKLVLEKWLQETEYPESVSSSSSDMPMMVSRKRKKRAVFTPQTKSALDKYFHQNPRPNRQAIDSIAQQLDLRPEEVRVWFCNKRQKQRHSTLYGSAQSPTSSSFVHLDSPTQSPKRSSPSPKTSFTIEELSKSSTNNSSVSSPVLMTSPLMISPGSMSISTTNGLYSLVIPNPTLNPLPHFAVTQTKA